MLQKFKPISAERAFRSGHAASRKLDGGKILGQIGPWDSPPSRRGSESVYFIENQEMSLVSADLVNFGENGCLKVSF